MVVVFFKFFRGSVDGKHLIRFQSKTLIFQISPAKCRPDLKHFFVILLNRIAKFIKIVPCKQSVLHFILCVPCYRVALNFYGF